jgi:hypothetical protein
LAALTAMRTPVKLPGPVVTASAVSCAGRQERLGLFAVGLPSLFCQQTPRRPIKEGDGRSGCRGIEGQNHALRSLLLRSRERDGWQNNVSSVL